MLKIIITTILLFSTSLYAIDLTQQEKQYLKQNSFTYAGNPNWLPFEAFDKNGKYIGIISEHVDIIEKKLDLKFKKIITKSWIDTLELSKKVGVDIISGDVADKVLAKKYKPIDIYLKNPLVIITKYDHPFITDLNHIKDKKIAYGDGAGYGADIKIKYPDIKFIATPTVHTGLLGVKNGKYDAFIGTLAMTDYSIIQIGIEGIKISGDTGITMNLTLFIDKDKPLLYSIINKTMNTIDEKKKHNILSKWRHSKIDKVIVDYTLVWQILGIICLIILFVLYQNRVNFKHNKELEKKIKEAVEKNNKQAQQLIQQSKLAQMGEMIGMIAHQWRQPLTAISSRVNNLLFKTMLDETISNKILEEELNKIGEYSQHLSKTIDDFRGFFDENKLKKITSLDEIVISTLNIVETSIENKNINIVKELNCNTQFGTYPNEVKQVVLNLIKNAEDVLLENKIKNPTITIQTISNTDKTMKQLIVKDNAGGIPDDIIDKIFDPYFSTKLEKDGTGLGLYMSKTIIEEHCGGKLSVSNDEDGAVFKIEFGIL